MKKICIEKGLLRKLYEIDKIETKEIARIFGCSIPTIYSNLREYKIYIRTVSESIKNLCNQGKIKGCFKKGNDTWKHPNVIKTQFKKNDLRLVGENNPSKRPNVRKKISAKLKGIKHSEEQVKNHSTKIQQLWDNGHYTKKRDVKISKTMKERGIKPKQTLESIEKGRNTMLRLYKEGLSSGFQKGELNYNWNNGSSFEPYGIEFNKELKEQIRKRDNYRCQQCFRHQDELFRKQRGKIINVKLCVHHIDFDKKNNDPKNLISLCLSCHAQTNFNREGWIDYFENKNNGGTLNG